jgi:predicted transcriptional regulator
MIHREETMRPKAVIITVSVAFALALSLFLVPQESSASTPSRTPSATPDWAGTEETSDDFYTATFLSNGDTYRTRSVVNFHGHVSNETDLRVAHRYVIVLMTDPYGMEYVDTPVTSDEGIFNAEFYLRYNIPGEYTVTALPDADPEFREGDTIRIMVVAPPPEEEEEEIPYVYFQLGALIAAFISMAVASTESAGFTLFNIFAFPMYSRLKKEEVLDHFVRGQIYGFIVSNPGEHYNSIREKLKVTNGTLSYHLRTLEVQGFIKSRKESIYRRFYPIEMKFPRDKGVKLSDLQIAMLDSMRRRPAPTQKDIASVLGISQQVASYNLRILARKGFVKVLKEGRKRMYYQADTRPTMGQ